MLELLAATDSPPATAIVGAVAGVLALIWNVFNYVWGRRPQVRVAQRVLLPSQASDETYGVEITVVNVGHTVESVMEIGLCRAPTRLRRISMRWRAAQGEMLTAASIEHFARGRVDEDASALREISSGITRLARGSDVRMIGFYEPQKGTVRSPAWPLPPGAIAQVDQSFLSGERTATEDPDVMSAATVISGSLTPYARLARRTVRFGKPIDVDADRIATARAALYAGKRRRR